MTDNQDSPFYSTREELGICKEKYGASYPLAFADYEFMLREELRPVRLQLELLKPELILRDHNIKETIVVFGSARTINVAAAEQELQEAKAHQAEYPADPGIERRIANAEKMLENSLYLAEAERFAELASQHQANDYYIVTGGGPGFMAAANLGAQKAGKPSVSLGVLLPHEQSPNAYSTPGLTFQFHYFAIRKMHFLMRAKALAAFPGGFGTLDELFEVLTLIQTQKIERIPLVLFNKKFWNAVINFEELVHYGTIGKEDLSLFHFVETADEAWQKVLEFYKK